MFKHLIFWLVTIAIAAAFFSWFIFLRGNGGLTRMMAFTGIYAVCQPKGYDNTVCFADRGTDGFYCMKLSDATKDGKCK